MPLTRPKAAQINFDVTTISDPLLRFNSDQTGSNDKDAGFIIERGDDTNVGVVWDESADEFAVVSTTETGTTSGNITISAYANIRANAFYGDGSNLTGVGSAGTELSNDSSPQLSGDLDLNSNAITGTGNITTTGTLSLTNTSTDDSLLITTTEDTSTAGPVITLKRNSSSPADADYLGQLKFKGENDADQEVVYAKITGKIQDASDGSEDGIIEFSNRKAGSNNINMRLRSDSLQLINGTNLYIGGTGSIQFEGANSNAYETLLQVEEPTVDRTVTLPDESGTVSLDAGWKKLGSANWTSDTGYADFSVVDPTKYRQYKVVWWISHRNSTNSGNQWFITSAVFLTSGGEVTEYDNNVTWRNSTSTSQTINNSTYAGGQSKMWLAGNGTTYDSHGEALFTVPNGSSFRAAMRGNSQLIGAPRQGTTAVNYLEEIASVAYNQDPTAITGIRIRSWNGTGYTSQAGNITIFGMEM